MIIIFIGGPVDGQWRNVKDLAPFYKITDLSKIPVTVKLKDISSTVQTTKHLYSLRVWQTDQDSYKMYALNTLSDGDVFRKLLEGYNPRA